MSSTTAASPPPGLDIASLVGPFALEAIVCAMLLGITLVQAKTYFERCGSDPTVLVVAVALLWALHVFHNVCLSHTAWAFTVTSFGDYAALAYPPWSFCIGAALTGISSFVVQSWYARQVYVLGQRKVLVPGCILVLSLVSLLFSIISTVKGYSYGDFRKFDDFFYGVFIWLLSSAAADILLTSALVYHLRQHKKETAFQDTKSLLNRVISNTIENNLLTCVVACVDAVMFGLYRQLGNWHVILNGMLFGLYYISFLTSLNAKHGFAEQRSSVRHMSSSLANVPQSFVNQLDLTDSASPATRRRSHGLIKVISRASLGSLSRKKSSDQPLEAGLPPSKHFALYRIDDIPSENKREGSDLTAELIDPHDQDPRPPQTVEEMV
ncbi:hypothetical protein ACM66B_002356 [Microbotryomycetes sp. NB124-2]